MFKLLIIQIFISFSIIAIGQDFNNYTPIQSEGAVPEDFTKLSSAKYESDKAQLDNSDSRKSKKVKKEFYLESNFGIDEILNNGRVLFNDPLSNYLNEIYAEIKKSNPELNDISVRFYTSRSTIVNAFTTHGGIIFFNVAILAKLKTEDEIAFVMCHEITHFIKKHNIKQYAYNDELDKERGLLKNEDWESKMFAKSNYSKAHETEADQLGFDLFKNTKYNPNKAVDALESLKTYKIPFESKSIFSLKMFGIDTGVFVLPSVLILDSIKTKTLKNTDKFSTHPNINLRISSIKSNLAKGNEGSTPNKVLTFAQFEMCHLYLEKGMFFHAIYAAMSLKKSHPESNYLNDIILKSIYGIAQTKTYLDEYITTKEMDYFNESNSKYLAAPIQQIKEFFIKSESNQLNALAISFLWNGIKKSKQSKTVMKDRLDGLIQSYKSYYKSNISNRIINNLIKNDPLFKKQFQSVDIEETDNNDDSRDKRSGKNNQFKGINNLLIISPEYRKFNLKNNKSYKYKASESLLKTYHTIINDNTEKLKIKKKVLSNSFIKKNEVDMFNDVALINSFLIENSSCAPTLLSSKREAILDLVERYGTDKISLMGIYSFQFAKSMSSKVGILLWTGIVFPTLPLGIWYAFKPNFITFNYTFLYDLSTEKMVYSNLHPIKMKGNKAVVTSTMYSDLLTIKKGAK